MLLKDKYKPKTIEDLYYFNCCNILNNLVNKQNYTIILHGKSSIGKTLILNVLKKILDKNLIVCNINTYFTKKNILILDDLDNLTEKEQFKIKKYLELGSSFIATSTNIHKIIKDIMVRCIILDLAIDKNYYENQLKYIINKENIELYNHTIKDILVQSNYNIAIAINFIQKISVIKMNYDIIIHNTMWDNYYNLCKNKNYDSLQKLLNTIIAKDYSYIDLIHSLLCYIKFNNKLKDSIKYKIIKLIFKYTPLYYKLQNTIIILYIFTNHLIELL